MLQNLSSAAVVIGALSVKMNGFSHFYQLDQSISALMIVGMFFFLFVFFVFHFCGGPHVPQLVLVKTYLSKISFGLAISLYKYFAYFVSDLKSQDRACYINQMNNDLFEKSHGTLWQYREILIWWVSMLFFLGRVVL